MREITIEVAGYPSAKNEATSILAARHGPAGRVRALLPAASRESRPGAAAYFPDEPAGLEVILTSPAPPPPNATDYPGGIADVLEDKQHRSDLPHPWRVRKLRALLQRQAVS